MLEGATFQAEQAARLATMGAWLTAGFTRMKKRLPPLKKVLDPGKHRPASGRAQSAAEQALVVRMLHARLGGTLITGAPTNG